MHTTEPRADRSRRSRSTRRRLVTALATLAALASTLTVTALAPAPAGAAPVSFNNATPIAIPGTGSQGAASPYPSSIAVTGLTGTVQDVNVTLNGYSHSISSDVDVLLVGPGGQSVVLMTDAGGNVGVSNVTFSIDDQASTPIPNPIVNGGTYQPNDRDVDGVTDTWPAPAPAPGGAQLSAFNGTAPNGTWSLYVVDDADGDIGAFAGGWTLTVDSGTAAQPGALQLSSATYTGTEGGGAAAVTVTRVGGSDGEVSATLATVAGGTATSGVDYTPVSTSVSFADGETSTTVDIPILDDATVEGIDETVNLSLTAPTGGATLGSPTSAVLRIQDDDARENRSLITVPGVGTGAITGAPADPYPSNIVVSGASGVVTDVNVTIHDLTHTAPMDVGILLVAPNGEATMLMSDVGSGANAVSDIDITFDDQAGGFLPFDGPITGGTYWPTDDDADDDGTDSFPAPAPAAPWDTSLDALHGSSPNGTWSLFVVDDAGADVGSIGGWSLDLTTATASAGGPYIAPEGSAVTLSGTTTPTVPGAAYAWDLDGDGEFDDATGATPTVSAATLEAVGLGDGPDASSVRVRATAGLSVITSSATTLTITNVAPTASLGNDGPVVQGDGATVTFTGQTDPAAADVTAGLRYSYDLDDDGTWDIGDGTYDGSVTSASAEVPAADLATIGTHDVVGRVIDKDGGFTTDTTTITVDPPPNASAQADAGDDQTVNPGDTVTLDGTGSSDADDDAFTYSWAQTDGPTVTLSGATTAEPTFTAPSSGTLTFTLTVDDDGAGPHTSTDTVVITVNQAPTANAGADQLVNEGDTVTLDGSASSDPDAGDSLTFAWTQTAGTPTVTLTGAATAQPTFTAPVPGAYTFQVTVTDENGLTSTDTAVITVNAPPTAAAGSDQTVNPGATVTLDGSASDDPDGDPLTYTWVQTAGPAVTLTGATTAAPTFTAPAGPATLTFQLTVDDGNDATDVDSVTIAVNGPPEADAGLDQIAQTGDTVTLDGSGSSDPDGDPLTYAWVQTAGPAVTLTGATTAAPTFTAPASGSVTFTLTVTDDGGLSDVDTVVVAVNRAPEASAGSNQAVNLGDTVTLDATGSTDPDGDTLTFSWAQTAGTAVTLTGAATAEPTFTAPEGPADLAFTLTVDDGRGGTDTAAVIVLVNGPPLADAGPDQAVQGGDGVTLDGSGSSDPDGDTLTYAWAQTAGTAVTLAGAATAEPTFTAPAAGTLTFELTVDDGEGRTDTDTVTISVNGSPVADAGADQTVNLGDTVTLDGSGSSDPDSGALTYAWEQTDGPEVTLTGSDTASPTFTAPEGPASLTFELTVEDGDGGLVTDTVTVTVNGPPVADAGTDQTVVELTEVALDGSASSDPDGDAITYAWVQTAGPAVTLADAATAAPTFTAPVAPGTLTFELTVDDGAGRTDTDSVTVTVAPRFTPDEAWVNRAYEVLTGRPADAAGLTYWVGRLQSGTSRVAVARQLALSVEGTVRTIEERYESWLGRPADAAGRDFWVAQVRSGRPLVDAELSLLSSAELYARGGGTDAGYVTELFEVILDRTPSDEALTFFEGRLASGTSTRRWVAASILGSPESERLRVRAAYDRILGRQPDATELAAAQALLDSSRDLRLVEISVAAQWVNQPGSST